MQEAFENIIEKLEERAEECGMFWNEFDDEESFGAVSAYTNAIKIVKQAAEEYNNGWIPCSERLPEPIRPVLVTLRNRMNDKCFVRVRRFHTDHWNTDEGIVENSVVIAWKPFPQPYRPNGE